MTTGLPPHQRHSAPSREAASKVKKDAKTLRQMVLEYLEGCGSRGATDDEIQEALSMEGSTERPRRVELQRLGYVIDSGRLRKTRSNRSATVWSATVLDARE